MAERNGWQARGWVTAISLVAFIAGGGSASIYSAHRVDRVEARMSQRLTLDRERYLAEFANVRADIRDQGAEINGLRDAVLELAKGRK